MAGSMAVASIGGASLMWTAPMVAASILVLWPWVASVGIAMTGAVMLSKWQCDLDWLHLSLSSWWCLECDLSWQLLGGLWWVTEVPEGDILCGQSMQCDHICHTHSI